MKKEELYDLMEKWKTGDLSNSEKADLKTQINQKELNDMQNIENIIKNDRFGFEPSQKIKLNLKQAFEKRHNTQIRKQSLFPISPEGLPNASNWIKWTLSAAAIGILLLSLKLNFNPNPVYRVDQALLADSLFEIPVDSNLNIPLDSIKVY
ncbi:MAG: hypothetical protein KDC83_06500 [Flavobacteriales bacterium]|nr:hypothetical protein [Flavobacteriales bacterium]